MKLRFMGFSREKAMRREPAAGGNAAWASASGRTMRIIPHKQANAEYAAVKETVGRHVNGEALKARPNTCSRF